VPEPKDPVWACVPESATVLLVTKGDETNNGVPPKRERGRLWFFPRAGGDDGAFAGHYPADCSEAIQHLEQLRAAGAEYLVFPSKSLWWFESYPQFGLHLRERYIDLGVPEAGRDLRIFKLQQTETPVQSV
jgi:hypothetical protein